MAAGDERIGPTAHYTAYVWHRIRLPYADLFATRTGARLFWSFRLGLEWPALLDPRVPTLAEWLEMRHRTIDRALDEREPDAVVELAGGLSRRGVTWAVDRGVRYVEIDLPHMVARKRRLIAERAPDGLRRRIDGALRIAEDDVLSEGFADRLAGHLEGAERPAVIAEGLLTYFEIPDRLRILSAVREALSGPGGWLLCDLRTRRGQDAMPVASRVVGLGARIATRGRGHQREWPDEDAVRAAFLEAGFDEAEKLPPVTTSRAVFPGGVWRARVRSRQSPTPRSTQ